MCDRYTYIYIWVSRSGYWKLMKNWWIIFIVGPASAWDYNSGCQVIDFGVLSLRAPYDTSIYNSYFRGLIIMRPTRHFIDDHHYKYDVIPIFISFPRLDVICPFYSLLWCNYQFTRMAGVGQVQEVIGVHKYHRFRSPYIIQDIKTGFP